MGRLKKKPGVLEGGGRGVEGKGIIIAAFYLKVLFKSSTLDI